MGCTVESSRRNLPGGANVPIVNGDATARMGEMVRIRAGAADAGLVRDRAALLPGSARRVARCAAQSEFRRRLCRNAKEHCVKGARMERHDEFKVFRRYRQVAD